MKTKTFSVTIKAADQARWIYNSREFARLFQEMLEPALCLIAGPRPRITVELERERCSLCGISPQRGGNRQGSALCESCFHDH